MVKSKLCGMKCKTRPTICRRRVPDSKKNCYEHRAPEVDDDSGDKDTTEIILIVNSVRFKTNVKILRNSQIPYFTAIVDGLGLETLVHGHTDGHRRHEIEIPSASINPRYFADVLVFMKTGKLPLGSRNLDRLLSLRPQTNYCCMTPVKIPGSTWPR
jgi:hypothetical protein